MRPLTWSAYAAKKRQRAPFCCVVFFAGPLLFPQASHLIAPNRFLVAIIPARCHHPVDALLPAVRHRSAHQLRGAHRGHVRSAPASRLLLHIRHSVHHLRPDYADRPDHVHLDFQGRDRLQAAAALTAAVAAVHVRVRPELLSVRGRLHSDGGGRRAERVPVHWAAAAAGGRRQCGRGGGAGADALLQSATGGEAIEGGQAAGGDGHAGRRWRRRSAVAGRLLFAGDAEEVSGCLRQ